MPTHKHSNEQYLLTTQGSVSVPINTIRKQSSKPVKALLCTKCTA
jgi:hypothetical protein